MYIRSIFQLLLVLFAIFSQTSMAGTGDNVYDIEYLFKLLPKRKIAEVTIAIEHDDQVSSFDFNLSHSSCYRFKTITPTGETKTLRALNKRLIWQPSNSKESLSFRCKLNHKRNGRNAKGYDALITKNWAIFRGDDLVPPAKVTSNKGARSRAILKFELPEHWPSVNTGWTKHESAKPSKQVPHFVIDNPQRQFDRPTGWMIAGKLGTRRALLGDDKNSTLVSVSAPKGSEFRRMDVLSFIHVLWPELIKVVPTHVDQLLILSGDDPMWRGGLSAGNSFYIHSDRPIISENGTSTLVHELFHMLTGIRGKKGNDWIAEGLAEYYSLEFLYRAGATQLARKEKTLQKLMEWSKSVSNLQTDSSSGAVTAGAAVLFHTLDNEIKTITKNKANLDDITKELTLLANQGQKASLKDLKSIFKKITGKKSSTLNSPLLRTAVK